MIFKKLNTIKNLDENQVRLDLFLGNMLFDIFEME
jgi:hypothetical protein